MGVTETLARYSATTTAAHISQDILHEGKRCFINFLAVALYASRDPSLDILLKLFQREGGGRHASIAGVGPRTTLQNAALANGYLGHLEDYDDTHFPTVIHPSSPTLPAVLAMGEQMAASGRDALVAAIVGMEVCCRIGMAVYPYHYDAGWHITGTCGVFGSVIAAGRLLELDTQDMIQAMGIAGTQASGIREVFGSMTKPFHPGRSAQSGVLAALLAQGGFSSSPTILEGRRGFGAVLSTETHWDRATDGLGEHWELQRNELKPYACGVVIHPLIDAVMELRAKPGVSAEAVASISARVHPLVLELVNRPDPQVGLEGKFSYQHSMAVGLIDGAAFPSQYSDDRVQDPAVAALRNRIDATIDSGMAEDAAEVTLTLKGGISYRVIITNATGAPDNPLTDAQLEEKFRVLTGDVLPRARVERLLNLLWNLDQITHIGEVLALARPRRRSIRQ